MRKLLAFGVLSVVCIITAVSGPTQSANQKRSVRDQFVGAWRLAWLEQPGADGRPHTIACCGMLVYTRDGHMSVQVMERDSPAQTPAGPEQYSQGGYEASYGTYDVDERSHTFVFHVEGSLVRSLVGKDLSRIYEFSENQLIVKSTRPDEHWRVCWERY
jgi:hypothetical protein